MENESSQSLTLEVVRKIAAYTNTTPRELPPLYNSIDPEAMDDFISSTDDGKIRFQHAGCVVMVHSDGVVEVSPARVSDTETKSTAVDD